MESEHIDKSERANTTIEKRKSKMFQKGDVVDLND